MNNAVIFHHYFDDDHLPMLELIESRHKQYADKHGFDFMPVDLRDHFKGVVQDNAQVHTVEFANRLIEKYEYIVWLDLDTIIWDLDTDLRDATDDIGAVLFQKDKPKPTKEEMDVVLFGWNNWHMNCGAVYIKRNPFTVQFLKDWYELAKEKGGWYGAQNAYNILAIERNIPDLDIKWNWCDNRHEYCEHPIVRGYHGYHGKPGRLSKFDAMLRDLKKL